MEELLDKTTEEKNEKKRDFGDVMRWIVFGLFILFLLMKNRHWPGGGVGLVFTGLIAMISGLIMIIQGFVRKRASKGMLDAAVMAAVIYLIFRLQFWQWADRVLVLMVGLMAIGLLMHFNEKKQLKVRQWFAIVMMTLCFAIYQTRDSDLYYTLNMTSTLNRYDHNSVSMAWESYARHLYSDGKSKQAIEALERAIAIASIQEETELVNYYASLKNNIEIERARWEYSDERRKEFYENERLFPN